jgi:hypothetical protein
VIRNTSTFQYKSARLPGHQVTLSLPLHEPEYDYQPPVDAMNNLALLFIIELLVFIGIVEELALALFQMLVAGCIMSLELQVGTCFGIRVCHLACCFGLDLDIESSCMPHHVAGMTLYGKRRTASTAEVCGMHAIAKPLPSYQAIQDSDDGPPELHYRLIVRT